MSVERVQRNWLITVVVCCAAVAIFLINWYERVRIPAIEERASFLEAQLEYGATGNSDSPDNPMALAETGVREGDAVTTNDGVCSIRVESVRGDTASLRVTAQSEDDGTAFDLVAGDNIIKSVPGATYFVYLLGTRGNIADVSAFRVGVAVEAQSN